MKNIFIFILFSICFVWNIFADWKGPITTVSMNWGKEMGYAGLLHGDTEDMLPRFFIVSKKNDIIINDWVNERYYIISSNGNVKNILSKKNFQSNTEDLPLLLGAIKENLLFRYNDKYLLYDYKGNLQNSFQGIISNEIYIIEASYIIVNNMKDGRYYSYNIDGQNLKIYDTKPLELGVIYEQKLGGNKYKVIVKYPVQTWEMIQEYGACPEYKRDACGNLYCGTGRFSSSGENLAPNEIIPQNKFEETPISTEYDLGTRIRWIEEYGEPVISPMGDVYTWKRTPDKYSIIKWVWVDGPECPQYLEVIPTKDSLKFTWQKPEKDADTVTGYQLLQSYNICGPFRQTALIKKDQLSYEDQDVEKGATLYYVVKAIRGKEYSGNSNKVCGQIE